MPNKQFRFAISDVLYEYGINPAMVNRFVYDGKEGTFTFTVNANNSFLKYDPEESRES